jgi:CheY-like chemotaxis protein
MTTEYGNALQIMLVEDNPADITLVRLALQAAGLDCRLQVIENGEQAIAFIGALDADAKAIPIDMLLLDLHLPRQDGDVILQCLRATKSCARTPVVVMTASDAPQDREISQKYAALHYFRKPASLDRFMELGMIVSRIVSRKSADNESAGRRKALGGAA